MFRGKQEFCMIPKANNCLGDVFSYSLFAIIKVIEGQFKCAIINTLRGILFANTFQFLIKIISYLTLSKNVYYLTQKTLVFYNIVGDFGPLWQTGPPWGDRSPPQAFHIYLYTK